MAVSSWKRETLLRKHREIQYIALIVQLYYRNDQIKSKDQIFFFVQHITWTLGQIKMWGILDVFATSSHPAKLHTWQVLMGVLTSCYCGQHWLLSAVCATLAFLCDQTGWAGLWSPRRQITRMILSLVYWCTVHNWLISPDGGGGIVMAARCIRLAEL